MSTARTRSSIVAAAAAVALAGGAGFGLTAAATHGSADVGPWSTTHRVSVTADGTVTAKTVPWADIQIKHGVDSAKSLSFT
jgi:hypothetical protein